MFGLCRSTPKESDSGFGQPEVTKSRRGSSETAESKSARGCAQSELVEAPRILADYIARKYQPDRRFSHPRTSGDSPLGPPAAPNVSPILAPQTRRRRQSDPNDMSKIRSRRSEDNSRSRSPAPSCAARVAKLCHHDDPIRDHRDTVELSGRPGRSTMAAESFRAASPISVSFREAMRSNV